MAQTKHLHDSRSALTLKPIDSDALEHMRTVFETKTLPKIKADTKRNARNVAIARTKIAYT